MISPTHTFFNPQFCFSMASVIHETHNPKILKGKLHKQCHGDRVYPCCIWLLLSVSYLVTTSVNRLIVNSIPVPAFN